ncbi:ROK family protein [Paenibacillus sp. 1P07SE]|uniref:ROK family protein n=1 Tax=Paenibacillus sp. 1P07SE TaxID=3132209 RepID=UPI0039A5218A
MSERWIGIDVGGTGIKGALVDAAGTIHETCALPTPVALQAEGIEHSILGAIRELLASGAAVAGIGVGTAGRIDSREGTVVYATDNLPGWSGRTLRANLMRELGMPVVVHNDANAAAIGEGWLGGASGARHYAMITLGTGVGGAIVHNDRLITGHHWAAGEFGHSILYPDGLACNCGQRGCLEQYVSGTALDRAAREIEPGWDAQQLMESYRIGDERAKQAVGSFLRDLSVALHSVQAMFDPERLVIGGGVAESHPLWWDSLLRRLAAISSQPIRIEPARLGNRAGQLGAARAAMLKGEM